MIYSIDGVPLTDPEGRWWVTAEGSAHSPGVTLRSIDGTIPGMNGIPDMGWETREPASLPLRVMVASRDPIVREARWEAVKALVASGVTFTLGRSVGGVARTTRAKLRSISEPDFSARHGSIVGVITLSILNGMFHDATSDVTQAFNADFTGVVLPHLGGTAPVEDWALRVRGPLTSASFTDVATATGIGWAGVLTSAQYLYIRGASARVSTSADAWDVGGADVSGGVTYPPSGILRLAPRPLALDPMVRGAKWSGIRAGSAGTTSVTLRAGASYA